MVRKLQTTSAGGGYGLGASFDADLKITFDKGVQEQYPLWFPLLDWLKKAGRFEKAGAGGKINGKWMEFLTEMRMGFNARAAGEDATLPPTASALYTPGKVDYMRGFQGRFDLTAAALAFGKGNGVYADVFKQESRNIKNVITALGAQAFWGAGTGILAKVNGNQAATALTVLSSELYNACYPGARWMHEGQFLSCLQAVAPVAKNANFTEYNTAGYKNQIVSINSDVSVTMNGSGQALDTELLCNMDDLTVGTTNYESYQGPEGVLAMVDGTMKAIYCGIDSSSYPQWKGVESHASGTPRPQTTKLIEQFYYKLGRKAGTVKLSDLRAWTNPDLYQGFSELLAPQIDYMPRKIESGYNEFDLMVNGKHIPISLDFMAPSYWMFLNPKKIHFIDARPLGLVSDNKGNVMVPTANKLNWEARFWWACNMYTKRRNAHGIIKDLIVSIFSL
jgi:hypothetical protein